MSFGALALKLTDQHSLWLRFQMVSRNVVYFCLLHIQGLPSQRATSNSSILAYLNVIKTISLIISCTKHLHNSFCIHFDALWCILRHSEHLQKNWLISTQKMDFFKLKFHTQNICTIHSAYILMHSDAYWCILST